MKDKSERRKQNCAGEWLDTSVRHDTPALNLFKDVVEAGDLNTGDALQKDCLWFCFAELLQEDLDAVLKRTLEYT